MRILFPSIATAQARTPFFIDEEGVGVWLSTDDPALLDGMTVIPTRRDAIHLPSMEKTGQAIPKKLLTEFIRRAQAIGLTDLRLARGYWTLSETGELQAEEILIAGSDQPVGHTHLLELARFILAAGHQDAVAWEEAGQVRHLMNLESQNR
ncbi:MAG: hypothetical protein U0401_25815 [Anaerolineae bacterium]